MRLRAVVVAVAGALLLLSASGYAQQKLTNQDVEKMVKAGLAEEVILTMISTQPGQFATSPDDLIALKKGGVSDKVIAAMVSKRLQTLPSPTVQPATVAQVLAGPDKPSDAAILSAIRSDPNRNNSQSPTALVMSTTPLGSGTRLREIVVTVEGFRAIQWGEFNATGKYWPVELCVNGTADNRVLANFTAGERAVAGGPARAMKFETKSRYRLYNDDFGGVKAEQILVNEWKPQDSVCPPVPSTSSLFVLPPGRSAASERLIAESTKGDQESSSFPIQSRVVAGTFDAVWVRVSDVLAKNGDPIESAAKEKGLIVTALTKHGSAPFARFDKYCIVLERVNETSMKILVKALLYSPTVGKSGQMAARAPARVAEQATKLLDQFAK